MIWMDVIDMVNWVVYDLVFELFVVINEALRMTVHRWQKDRR